MPMPSGFSATPRKLKQGRATSRRGPQGGPALTSRSQQNERSRSRYGDLFASPANDKFFREVAALTLRERLIDDPDLADPERNRQIVAEFAKRIQGIRDAFYTYPWTRMARDAVFNGHVAAMTGGAAKVYLALHALVEPRTLVTTASLETIAKYAGRSTHTTSKNLTRLKKSGLIKRWCIKHPEANDEDHYLWFTKISPEGACATAEDRDNLLKRPALPKET